MISAICGKLIVNIFNQSIESGIFPEDLRIAVISRIFTTGDKTQCTNYRPFEQLIYASRRLEEYRQLEGENLERVSPDVICFIQGCRKQSRAGKG